MRKKIGECLIQAGLITEEDLQRALAEHKRTGERLGAVLIRMNLASEKQITKALAHQLGFPYINLSEEPPDPAAMILIPKGVALKRVCVAVRLDKNLLTVAMSDPLLFSLVRDLEFQTGYRIKQVVTTRSEILEAIATGYPDKALIRTVAATDKTGVAPQSFRAAPAVSSPTASGSAPVSDHLRTTAGSYYTALRRSEEEVFETANTATAAKDAPDTGPLIELVDSLVKAAVTSKASDVHIEPMEHGVLVRHRLDGLLKEVMELPKWMHEGLVARVKVMSSMDIAEKRIPQDGRLRLAMDEGTNVDFRVSSMRTLHGEKMVLRILDNRKGPPALTDLGFSEEAMEELQFFLKHQHGMILVVGPTGSGKSTTLSSALSAVKSTKTNIITVEDPIEYQIAGINQTQINEKAKLTFANALRAILRQDPDVILVGEIRDHETAKIALQASQTGHLVLSTLHTEDAPSTITRLMDMGTEPYIISSALLGVVAQRLLRRLCSHCKRPYTPTAETLRAMNITDVDAAQHSFFHAVGCDECNHTGYKGRVGIYEVMRVTDKMRRLISQRAGEESVRDLALASGMRTLGEDGLLKVKAGITTPDELLRVVTEVQELRTLCAGCGAAVGLDYFACPACGRRLSGGCQKCGRTLQPGWTFCAFCATPTGGRTVRELITDERKGHELTLQKVSEFKIS